MSVTSPIILHHFDQSPFSEKIRLIFGLKKITWSSVRISRIMPRPDLMPLTGGYRRTPVMQIGADIYCDTRASGTRWLCGDQPGLVDINAYMNVWYVRSYLPGADEFLAGFPR